VSGCSCIKEIRRNTRDGTSSKEVEEDFPLVSKENKAKGKQSQEEEGDEKKDLSNIKCFHYYELGHYATKFPQKKARKKESAVATLGEALASKRKLDFTPIACMERIVMGRFWYLNNGASFQMTGNINLFSDLEEKI